MQIGLNFTMKDGFEDVCNKIKKCYFEKRPFQIVRRNKEGYIFLSGAAEIKLFNINKETDRVLITG